MRQLFAGCLLVMFSIMAFESSAQKRRPNVQNHFVAQSGCGSVEAYPTDGVDVPPEFPGGELGLMRYINRERRYPADAYEDRVQGRVLCGFVVKADGSIGNVEVLSGVDERLNREAVRVISKMPRWSAGRKGNSKVNVFCVLSVHFRL